MDPAPDSPPRNFVPLSLQDTLQPKRVLPLSASARRLPRASTTTSSGGGAPSATTAKEKAAAAKAAAAAMCETLGIPSTPLSPSLLEEEAPEDDQDEREVDKDAARELAQLRKRVGDLSKENGELRGRCDRLDKERKDALAAAATATAGGAGKGGLGAKQLEELEKSFAEQEALLGGYQRDAERSFAEMEALKRHQRRLTDFLSKTFGPNWESDLSLGAAGTGIPLIAPATLAASPAIRSKLQSRQSLMGTPTLPGGRATLSSLRTNSLDQAEEGQAEGDEDEVNVPGQRARISPEALRSHLEAVQTALRGMEQRLIAREVELEKTEQRARSEAALAEEKGEELAVMVKRLEAEQ